MTLKNLSPIITDMRYATLKKAIHLFNKHFGLNLTMNYTHNINSISSSNNWIEVDDGIVINQHEVSVINIPDDEDATKDDSYVSNDSGYAFACDGTILTHKVNYSRPVSENAINDFAIRVYFPGFYPTYIQHESIVSCPLCLYAIRDQNLLHHLDNDCIEFLMAD